MNKLQCNCVYEQYKNLIFVMVKQAPCHPHTHSNVFLHCFQTKECKHLWKHNRNYIFTYKCVFRLCFYIVFAQKINKSWNEHGQMWPFSSVEWDWWDVKGMFKTYENTSETTFLYINVCNKGLLGLCVHTPHPHPSLGRVVAVCN